MRTTTPLLQYSQTSSIRVVSQNGCVHVSAPRGTFILRRVMAILPNVLPAGAHLVLVVQNEIVLERPLPLLEEATSLLKEALIAACRTDLKLVRIPEPEVLVAPSWMKNMRFL
ncbi:MAG TPA: hypothetical protein VFV38_22330 [Ktedonobacteraceae bacterium]|nr:hypothetical protein [Ktedonobacteraceae bacterium]